MRKNSKIYIAGHKGLVGSAFLRALQGNGYSNLIYKTHSELDLINQKAVQEFFEKEKPEYVFIAAAKVGGIHANNTYPAQFLFENLAIQNNIIHTSYIHGVKKLLFLGSTCIYPRLCPQPMKEEYLLTGPLEPTNESYAIAKIAGIKMCHSYNRQYGTNFIAAMPTNLYGINDNFDLNNSHVLPAFIRKFHEAKIQKKEYVEVWGTGVALREFLFVDDLAHASLFLMDNFNPPKEQGKINEVFVNIGTGVGITVQELAELMKKITGYQGKIRWDTTKPDGMPKKITDVERITRLGWRYTTNLKEGLQKTYAWYQKNNA